MRQCRIFDRSCQECCGAPRGRGARLPARDTETAMPNHVRFFSIMVDDDARARRFYTEVFGWTFEDWGPPGFYLIRGAGLEGSLHKRQEPLTGTGFRAFEVTVGVDDVDDIARRVAAAGGTITMPKMR